MWYFSTFTPATDYSHYALARAYQGLGYGFFFVPVNVLAWSPLRPDQNNKASSLTNLLRNWGGSFGIAFITTASQRRDQLHQSNLGSAIGGISLQLASRVGDMTNYLVTKGFSGPDAATAANGYVYQQLQHQVSLLSFMDCFRVIAWLTLAAVPLLLFVRRFKPAGKAPGWSLRESYEQARQIHLTRNPFCLRKNPLGNDDTGAVSSHKTEATNIDAIVVEKEIYQ